MLGAVAKSISEETNVASAIEVNLNDVVKVEVVKYIRDPFSKKLEKRAVNVAAGPKKPAIEEVIYELFMKGTYKEIGSSINLIF